MPRIVGSAKAREMYILNQKVNAAEAQRIGLCSGVFETPEKLLAGVADIAAEIAAAPPLSLKRIKQNLNAADENNFVEGLDVEAENHARSAFHPDAQEAGAAFVEKRVGNFSGTAGAVKPWMKSRI